MRTGGDLETWRWALFISTAVGGVWSFVNWHRTTAWDVERASRRDIMLLFVLLVAALTGDLLRSRFVEGSIGFLVSTFAMIPIALCALAITIRLMRIYRRRGRTIKATIHDQRTTRR